MAHSMVDNMKNIINRCAEEKEVSTQNAMFLLRVCFNSKLDYLMRCLGPNTLLGWGSDDGPNIDEEPNPNEQKSTQSPPSTSQPAKRSKSAPTNSTTPIPVIDRDFPLSQDDNVNHRSNQNKRDRTHSQAPVTPLSSKHSDAKRSRHSSNNNSVDHSSQPADEPNSLSQQSSQSDTNDDQNKSCIEKFDAAILNFALKRLKLDSNFADSHKRVIEQMRMPINKGGLGLKSARSRICAAYVASMTNALRTVTDIEGLQHLLDNSGRYAQHCRPTVDNIFKSLDSLHTNCTDRFNHLNGIIDKTPTDFIKRNLNTPTNDTSPARGIQHKITSIIDMLDWKYFILNLERDQSSADWPNYLASSAPGTSAWVTTLPVNPRTTFTDFEFIVAACMRLNIEPRSCSELSIFSNDCFHCNKSDSHSNDPWHMVSCPSVQKFTTIRHDNMVKIAYEHFDMMNTHASREPAGLFPGSDLRPDIRVNVGDKVYLLDFCIVHPSCPSNIAAARDHALGAAGNAERRKDSKYSTLASSIHAEFFPIIFETLGGVGKSATKFLDLVHRFESANPIIRSQTQIMGSLRSALACALQKGNAMIVKQYLARASQQDGEAYVFPSQIIPITYSQTHLYRHSLSKGCVKTVCCTTFIERKF